MARQRRFREGDVVRWSSEAELDLGWKRWAGGGPFVVIHSIHKWGVVVTHPTLAKVALQNYLFVLDPFLTAVRKRRHGTQ